MDLMTNNEILKVFGERIRKARIRQNLTQKEIAERSGMSVLTIKNVESGKKMQFASLISIIRVLGLLSQLESFLLIPEVSPLERLKHKKKERKRVRKSL